MIDDKHSITFSMSKDYKDLIKEICAELDLKISQFMRQAADKQIRATEGFLSTELKSKLSKVRKSSGEPPGELPL